MSRVWPALLLLVSSLALSPTLGVIGAEAKPLSRKQILDLLQGGVSSHRVVTILEQRGISFEPGEEKGDHQGALEQYRIAAQISPQDASIRSNLERAEHKTKRPSLVKK